MSFLILFPFPFRRSGPNTFVPVDLPARFVHVAFVPASSGPVNDTNLLGPVNASVAVSHHCITTRSSA